MNSRYYIRNPGRDCRSDPGDCVDCGSGSIIVGLDRRLDHCHRWAVFQCEQGQETEGSQTGGTSGQKHTVHGRKRDFSDRTGRTSCCNGDADSFGRRRSRPLLRAGDEDCHEEQGCRPNRKRCWRPCPRCEGRVGKHWRRFQSDGLRRSDRNLFGRYRFNE